MTHKDSKFIFANFEKAYFAFRDAITRKTEIYQDSLLRAGLIQCFEYSIELSWKFLKVYLEEQGFGDLSSPKKVLRLAYQYQYISNGELWLQALDNRNLTVHTYDNELAESMAKTIIQNYYPLIEALYLSVYQKYQSLS